MTLASFHKSMASRKMHNDADFKITVTDLENFI